MPAEKTGQFIRVSYAFASLAEVEEGTYRWGKMIDQSHNAQ
ncbi:hypothetical protein [Bacillus piscicola]|nr:hypothetical protein [Bacillus piscicola]